MARPDVYPYTVFKKEERRHLQKLRNRIFFYSFLSVAVLVFYVLWLAAFLLFHAQKETMFILNIGFCAVFWGLVGMSCVTPFNWIFPWAGLVSARREYVEYKAYYDFLDL